MFDKYLKITRNSNYDSCYMPKVEAHGLAHLSEWDGHLIGTSSKKQKKTNMRASKLNTFIFLCFCKTNINQVIVSLMRTSMTTSFYFHGMTFVVIGISNDFQIIVHNRPFIKLNLIYHHDCDLWSTNTPQIRRVTVSFSHIIIDVECLCRICVCFIDCDWHNNNNLKPCILQFWVIKHTWITKNITKLLHVIKLTIEWDS
jgi:hypothetical protein